MYSIPYSGNSLEAIFLTTNKTITSRMLKDAGINNPASYKPSEMNLLKPGNQIYCQAGLGRWFTGDNSRFSV